MDKVYKTSSNPKGQDLIIDDLVDSPNNNINNNNKPILKELFNKLNFNVLMYKKRTYKRLY